MSATWDSKTLEATPVALDELLIIDISDGRRQHRSTLGSLQSIPWTVNQDAATFSLTNLTTLNTHTIPGGTSTFALQSDNLSVFAATTSLQLLGVISDETGTGSLVFADAPTLNGSVSINADEKDVDINGLVLDTDFIVHGVTDALVIQIAAHKHSNTAAVGAIFDFARSRGTEGAETAVVNGDALSSLISLGHDGTNFQLASSIQTVVDGVVATQDMPTAMIFSVNTGTTTVTEAFRISSTPTILVSVDLDMQNNDILSAQTLGLQDTSGVGTVTFTPNSGQTGNHDMQIPNLDDNAEIIFDNQPQQITNKTAISMSNTIINTFQTNYVTAGVDAIDIAKLQFIGRDDDSVPAPVEYANITISSHLVSAGDEYGKFQFNVMSGGSLQEIMSMNTDDGELFLTDLSLNMGTNGISNCNEIVFVGTNTHIVADTNTTLQLVCNTVTDDIVMRYSATDRHIFSELSADMQGDLELKTNNTTALLSMEANHTTPADDAVIGQIDFYDDDDLNARRLFAQIETTTEDVTNTTIDGGLILRVAQNNVLVDALKMNVLTQTIETPFTIQGSNTISTTGSMDCNDMAILTQLDIGGDQTGSPGTLQLLSDSSSLGGILTFESDGLTVVSLKAADQSTSSDNTIFLPDVGPTITDTLVVLAAAQTMENKTFDTLTMVDATDIILGTTTGTKIGTATTQKIGFFNATPIIQPIHIVDATDAASVITQLNLLLAQFAALGLQASA